jgi:hypothetical protein
MKAAIKNNQHNKIECKNPLFSLNFLMMQRVYRLSLEFGQVDQHGDYPIQNRLFDGVHPEEYNRYLNQIYNAIGVPGDHGYSTGNTVRHKFQAWWVDLQKFQKRSLQLSRLMDEFNTRMDPNGRLRHDDDFGKFMPYPQSDSVARNLWALDELIAIICGKTYSQIRTEILETPYVDYQHLPNQPKDLFSLNILELTPRFFHPEGSDYDEEGWMHNYRGEVVSTTMDSLLTNIDRALAERIENIVERGDAGENCIDGFEVCINQQPVFKYFLNFKGYDNDPIEDRNRESQYSRYNLEGTSAYEIDGSRTIILNESYPNLQELLDLLPRVLHDQVLEAALENDLNL